MRKYLFAVIIGLSFMIITSVGCKKDSVSSEYIDQIVVTPFNVSVKVDSTVQLTAQALDPDGNIIEGVVFTWISSDTSVAFVDRNGLVTGISCPAAEIRAYAEDVESNAAVVTVITSPAEVQIFPLDVAENNSEYVEAKAQMVRVGKTAQVKAVCYDSCANEIPDVSVSWELGDSSLVEIDTDGELRGVSRGETWVKAIYEQGGIRIESEPLNLYIVDMAFEEGFSGTLESDTLNGYFVSSENILWQLNYQLATDSTDPGPKAGKFHFVEDGGEPVLMLTDPTTAYYANRQILLMTYGSDSYNSEFNWPDTVGMKTENNWRVELRFKVADDPAPYTTAEVFVVFTHYFSGGSSPYYMNYAMGRNRVSVWFGTTPAPHAMVPEWGSVPEIDYDVWVNAVVELFENVTRTEVYSGSEPTGNWTYSFTLSEWDENKESIPGLWLGTFNTDTLYLDDIRYYASR